MAKADGASTLSRLYLITDRTLAERNGGLEAVIRGALEGGVRLIQLREKDLSAGELLILAKRLRAMTDGYGARLIINDRADIALLARADGVHLGVKGLSPVEARRVLGKEALIGVSAHGVTEAKEAQEGGADFITIGPVFFTPSKAAYGRPLGLDIIGRVKEAVDIPVYAIGGINRGNLGEVIKAGACAAAVISAVMAAEDVRKNASELLAVLKAGQEKEPPKPIKEQI